MVSKRPRGIVPRKDKDPFKLFPNGLRATAKSIRKYWPKDVRPGPGRSPAKFSKYFLPTYNEVISSYGGTAVTQTALSRTLSKLESSGEKDLLDFNFGRMRAYAQFVELPTGLFLIFTQAVSLAAQGRNRDDVIAFLEAAGRAIAGLETFARQRENRFHSQKGRGDTEYEAVLAGLAEMTKAYNATPTKT